MKYIAFLSLQNPQDLSLATQTQFQSQRSEQISGFRLLIRRNIKNNTRLQNHGTTESQCLRSEGISGSICSHPAPPGSLRAECPGPCQGSFWTSPPIWAERFIHRHEAMEQVAQRLWVSHPWRHSSQVESGPEEPDLAAGNLAHSKGAGAQRSLRSIPTYAIL